MRDGYRSNFMNRYGKLVDVDSIEKEDALEVTLEQVTTRSKRPMSVWSA